MSRKKLLPAPREDAGVVTYIQPHLMLRGVTRLKDDDQTLEYDFHISGLGNEHGFVLQFKANGE